MHFSRHLSLLMIIAGAGAFFLANIVLKELLNELEYGQYSIFVTYFSLIYVFGIFGTEQTFLRFSKRVAANIIETQKTQLYLIGFLATLTASCGTFFLKYYYSEIPISTSILFFSSFSMIAMMFLYNILRLNVKFVLSQFVTNYWKIILFVTTFFFYFKGKCSLEDFIFFIMINIIAIFLFTLFYISRGINLIFTNEVSSRSILVTSFHFFLAILGFSLITFADRFIIERKFSIAELGNYFYLTNFFLAPFTILQNYIGFKQLIVFKEKFDKDYYISFNRRAIFLGFIVSFSLVILSYFLSMLGLLKIDFSDSLQIILLLLLLGMVRLYSSSVISAFEARTSITTLRNSNFYILLFTIILMIIAIVFTFSIEATVICFIIVWMFRCIVHRQLLLLQIK